MITQSRLVVFNRERTSVMLAVTVVNFLKVVPQYLAPATINRAIVGNATPQFFQIRFSKRYYSLFINASLLKKFPALSL